jgi:hypothetical protein
MTVSAQLRMPGAGLSAAAEDRGYRTKRRGVPARNVTSLEMTLEERALLRALAEADGIAMSEVLRRGLRLYAAQAAAANQEVATAA